MEPDTRMKASMSLALSSVQLGEPGVVGIEDCSRHCSSAGAIWEFIRRESTELVNSALQHWIAMQSCPVFTNRGSFCLAA